MSETVSKEEFEKLKEEVEHMKENVKLLANPKVIKELEKAKDQINKGNGIPLDDIEKEFE